MRYNHLSNGEAIEEGIKMPRVSSKDDETERHQSGGTSYKIRTLDPRGLSLDQAQVYASSQCLLSR